MSNNTVKENQTVVGEKLTPVTRIAYGCGDTACNIVFGMISTLLTLFYTDYAGISVVTVGLVMLVSRIFDGSSDVIMGILVNKTKTRFGKARPWILWMSVPYCVAAISLFCVPQSANSTHFWYIFITYNLCTTVCYTAINVPYGTLSTMMTRSSHERDLLSVFRMSMAPLGRIIAVTFTMPVVKLFGDDQAAWIKAMSMWVVIAMIMLIICFVKCKETVHFEQAEKKENKASAGSLKRFWETSTSRLLWFSGRLHAYTGQSWGLRFHIIVNTFSTMIPGCTAFCTWLRRVPWSSGLWSARYC